MLLQGIENEIINGFKIDLLDHESYCK
jgi:hypothetical protein